MRILAITSLYPRPGHETFASFNRQQFRALSQVHDLRVVAPVAWTEGLKSRRRQEYQRGWSVNGDGVRVCHPTYYFPPRVLQHLYGHLYRASVRPVVSRLVREWRPDVVLACWAHPDGWAAVRLARAFHLPVVIKVIGSDILVTPRRDPLRRRRVVEALNEADVVYAVSRDLADHTVRLGVDPGTVRVVSEGLDESLFFPGDKEPARARLGLSVEPGVALLLFVGNLLLSKGAGVLVEAARLLADRGVSARCLLVGRGPDERRIRALIERHQLGDRVVLLGPRPHAELPDWYRASDLFVLPSFSEGIPNVLREATACGLPFVATRVGGIPEIADESVCRLVTPGAADELAGAIESILTNLPTAEAVRSRARNISCEESARRVTEQLRDAVSRSRCQGGAVGRHAASPVPETVSCDVGEATGPESA